MTERMIPWHTNGTKLNNPPSVSEALKQSALNWAVLKTSMFNGVEPPPGRKFVVREDLWAKHGEGLLGTIRENDEPMQMLEAFGFLDSIMTSGDASFDAAGVSADYSWPWMILRFSGDPEVVPGDPIGRFVLFLHSPAITSYRLSYLPVRLAGANTVAREDFHNPEPLVTIPNDRPRRFKAPLSAVLQEFHRQFDERIDEFRAMARIRLDQEILQRYLNIVVNLWMNSLSRFIRTPAEAIEAETQKSAICRSAFDCLKMAAETTCRQ